jgi:hypothetical protein
MVLRKQPGLVKQDGDTPRNSGWQKDLPGAAQTRTKGVNLADPHAQAKDEGKVFSGNAKHVERHTCSACDPVKK